MDYTIVNCYICLENFLLQVFVSIFYKQIFWMNSAISSIFNSAFQTGKGIWDCTNTQKVKSKYPHFYFLERSPLFSPVFFFWMIRGIIFFFVCFWLTITTSSLFACYGFTNPIETRFFSIASSLYAIMFIAYLHHHRFRRSRTNIIWTISILSPISNFFWRGFIYAEVWHYLKHQISLRLSVPLKKFVFCVLHFFDLQTLSVTIVISINCQIFFSSLLPKP